mmetsp:Transcript_61590/g.150774  ORF Transcript_61590/g.150774 Transcript_61590/m.150774 type:complete len:426 (-) Transcript_61590:20-1297(-)
MSYDEEESYDESIVEEEVVVVEEELVGDHRTPAGASAAVAAATSASASYEEEEFEEQVIEKWVFSSSLPDDLDGACRTFIRVMYGPDNPDHDADTMIRRAPVLSELYKYLKQEYDYRKDVKQEDVEEVNHHDHATGGNGDEEEESGTRSSSSAPTLHELFEKRTKIQEEQIPTAQKRPPEYHTSGTGALTKSFTTSTILSEGNDQHADEVVEDDNHVQQRPGDDTRHDDFETYLPNDDDHDDKGNDSDVVVHEEDEEHDVVEEVVEEDETEVVEESYHTDLVEEETVAEDHSYSVVEEEILSPSSNRFGESSARSSAFIEEILMSPGMTSVQESIRSYFEEEEELVEEETVAEDHSYSVVEEEILSPSSNRFGESSARSSAFIEEILMSPGMTSVQESIRSYFEEELVEEVEESEVYIEEAEVEE